MLARNYLDETFKAWNIHYHAPFGKSVPAARQLKKWLPKPVYWRLRGPFSIQRNNSTRYFEYPWAYFQADLAPGRKVVEVGGGLSGFQFVLARAGCDVLNIDPGLDAKGKGWPCDQKSITRLNKLFDTDVRLSNTTIEAAGLESNSIDYVFSISVIEHLPWEDVRQVMRETWRCLKPGGKFILTLDLFPDIAPFTEVTQNKYGTNINVKKMLALADFEMIVGEQAELYGFQEFDLETIQKKLNNNDHDYLIGEGYPALVQCLVLRKRG